MEVSTVVIDTGAYSTRAGFGGDNEPQCILPTVVGRPKPVPGQTTQNKDIFAGSDVISMQSSLNLKCPISDRVITNTDEIESLWGLIFRKELNINTEEHPVLMTESPQNTKQMREKTTQIMMETFKTPAFYLAYPEVLSLYAENKISGLVIDAGETITHVLPVYKCFGMTHVTGRLDIGGRMLNAYLKKLISDNGGSMPAANEREIVRDIKEKLCFVAPQKADRYRIECGSDAEADFPLEDGSKLTLSQERFYCPELFFNPQLLSSQATDAERATLSTSQGIVQLVSDVIGRVDEDMKQMMCENICLSGGSSMFPGFAERLKKELSEFTTDPVCVTAQANRKNSAWIGGSILVSLATFSQMWVTKAEYDEVGPEIINLKCF